MPREPLRVLVQAPLPAMRLGLRELLRGAGFEIVEEHEAPGEFDTFPAVADIVVVDLGEGQEDDLGLAETPSALPAVYLIAAGSPRPRPDATVPGAWISRDASSEELAAAIHAVAAGMVVLDPAVVPDPFDPAATPMATEEDVHLTARELEVLRLLASGLPNKGIALELGISEHTVKFHVGAVLSKLEAHSRTEAVTQAARRGLLIL